MGDCMDNDGGFSWPDLHGDSSVDYREMNKTINRLIQLYGDRMTDVDIGIQSISFTYAHHRYRVTYEGRVFELDEKGKMFSSPFSDRVYGLMIGLKRDKDGRLLDRDGKPFVEKSLA